MRSTRSVETADHLEGGLKLSSRDRDAQSCRLKWPVRSSASRSARATRCTGCAAEKRYSMPLTGPRTTIGERAR